MTETLLITTYNRSVLLARSLRALTLLTKPDEIVVVDDGGDDDCEKVCGEYAFKLGVPIHYVWNNRPGWTNCCQARNIGLRMAFGDDVLVSEPEIEFVSDVVAQMREARTRFPDLVLREPVCYHDPFPGATLDECDVVPGFYVNYYKREWLLSVGGWDEDLPGPWGWDDLDLFRRLELAGHPRTPVHGVAVHHLWHPSRIEPARENEEHARAKGPDVVANAGREWGVLRR